MSITFLSTITDGTKILLRYLNGSIAVKEEVATITSIQHYNKDLYSVTFKETHLKGTYCFSMEQLIQMKMAYDESKK